MLVHRVRMPAHPAWKPLIRVLVADGPRRGSAEFAQTA